MSEPIGFCDKNSGEKNEESLADSVVTHPIERSFDGIEKRDAFWN